MAPAGVVGVPPVPSPGVPLRAGAPGPHCCFSPCLPCRAPKLLGQDEKEKYADMARAWRAAQGKESGSPEQQVKVAGEEQPPAWPPGHVQQVSQEPVGHVGAARRAARVG